MFRNHRLRAHVGPALILSALALAAPGVARAQAVQFAMDSLSVSEGDAYAVLSVTISQAPVSLASVRYETASGTADGGVDFTSTSGPVTWYTGDGDPHEVFIGILWDPDPEANETFTVELSQPLGEATLGSRTTMTVTIVDDDEAQVFLDVADAFDPDTGKSYWVLPDPQADVPVRLTKAAAAGGVAAGFASTLAPASGTVPFAEGESAGTIHLDFPGGNSIADETWIADPGALDLVTAPPGMNVGLPGSLVLAWVRPVGGRGSVFCLQAFVSFLLWVWGDTPGPAAEPDSPSLSALPPDPLDTLRRYRDEVLSTTSVGQYYTALYTTHSPALIDAIFASPSLAIRTLRGQEAWIDAIDALVNGNGDSATVTAAMQSDLSTLLDAYAALGSSELASAIATERARLQLDSVAGLTMTAFQDQIETLGAGTPLERMSWSRIKAHYRSEPAAR